MPLKRDDFKHKLSQKMTMQSAVCFGGRGQFSKSTSIVERREKLKAA
jgi:hypothetical protein